MRKRRPFGFVAAIIALFALLAPVALSASATENVAGNNGWERTGSLPMSEAEKGRVPDLGTNVHRGQGIHGWCAKDDDAGPRSTRGADFTYPTVRTIAAGNTYHPNPSTHATPSGETDTSAVVWSDNFYEFAYILNAIGAKDSTSRSAHEAQAVHYALVSLTEGGPSTNRNFSQQLASASVKSRAAAILAEAKANKGPYKAPISLDMRNGGRTGFVDDIGIRSAAGNWLAGYDYTVTLSGPAVFDNGSKSFNGTTVGKAAYAGFKATGNGKVTATITIDGVPATAYRVLEDTLAQDMWTDSRPMSVSGEASGNVKITFVPEAVTKATEQVKIGEQIADEITLSAAQGQWGKNGSGNLVRVRAKATVYGPLDTKPRQQASVPEGTPIAGSFDLDFYGPSTKTTPGVTVSKPGYYTWVVSIDKAVQAEETQELLEGNYASPFGEAVETTLVVDRDKPAVVSKAVPSVKVGQDFTDTAIVTDTDSYFANHKDEDHYVAFELFGPSEKAVCETPIFTSAFVKVNGGGEYTSPATKVHTPGNYHWVETLYEVPKGEQPNGESTVLHRGECGAPDETTTIGPRDLPLVSSKAAPDAYLGEKFGDTAIIVDDDDALSQPGWRWEVSFEAYGPYAELHETQDNAPEGEKPFFTTTPIVVDKAGEYASEQISVDKTGYVYWVEILTRTPIDADGKPTGEAEVVHRGKWALPEETTHITEREGGGAKGGGQALAVTGADGSLPLAALGALFLVGGTASAVLRKRKAN